MLYEWHTYVVSLTIDGPSFLSSVSNKVKNGVGDGRGGEGSLRHGTGKLPRRLHLRTHGDERGSCDGPLPGGRQSSINLATLILHKFAYQLCTSMFDHILHATAKLNRTRLRHV